MLSSQRALFDIPSDVCVSERGRLEPAAARHAGGRRARPSPRKGQPWKLAPDSPTSSTSAPAGGRRALIGAEPRDVALVSSVGYGVAIAGKVLAIPRGSRVLVLENDHTSPVLEWMTRADAQGFTVETVAQPANGDWTSAVLEAIERPGAPPLSLASISSIHWSDGGLLDMHSDPRCVAAARRGAAGRCHAQRRRDRDRREDARSGFPDLPDLQMGARPLRPRLRVRREAPSGRRAARTDLVRTAQREGREPGLLRRHALSPRCAALRHGRARSFHLDGDGCDRHGDDGVVGRGRGRRSDCPH